MRCRRMMFPASIWIKSNAREVCQLFCVNDQVLFLGMGARGKGAIPPSLAQRCRRILRFHDATLSRAGIRSGHKIVKWFNASRQW
jgi:hypothetical protein